MFEYVVSKAEDRKIMLCKEFEAISSKFWHLLHTQPAADRTQDVLTKEQYKAVSQTSMFLDLCSS